MTREEAIKTLANATIEPTWGGSFSATSEALKMAIEALKREDTMLKEIEHIILYKESEGEE